MNAELVTIATFSNYLQANLARDELRSNGIHCVVPGDDVGGFLGMYTGSIGVKLCIRREDLKAAREILSQIDSVEIAEELPEEADQSEPEKVDPGEPNQREQLAGRAFRSAVIGCLFVPLQAYTSWLLLRVWFSDEPLRNEWRRRALVAMAINVPFVLIFLFVLKFLFFSR